MGDDVIGCGGMGTKYIPYKAVQGAYNRFLGEFGSWVPPSGLRRFLGV